MSRRHQPRHLSNRNDSQRRQLAEEAARIIESESIRDYQLAKRKAAARLGVTGNESLPTNAEVEAALSERIRLFEGKAATRRLHDAIQVAIEVMEFFQEFSPRLSGSLVRDIFSKTMPVELHLFAEVSEDVTMMLIAEQIPYELIDKRVRYGGDRYRTVSAVRLQVEETTIEALVFRSRDLREPPLSPVDGLPMERLDAKAVKKKERVLGAI